MTAANTMQRILIADDHTLFRRGLNLVLHNLFGSVDVVEAGDVEAALERLSANGPFDLVLLDLAMPGMASWDGLGAVREKAGDTPVVILSAHQDPSAIRASIEAGARGYLLKSFTEDSLRHALALIQAGEIYVPSSVLFSGERAPDAPVEPKAGEPEPSNPLHTLTKRQYDVLMLVMQGHPNKAIARSLGVFESTVKAHVQVILQKLHAENRTHAAMIAREWAGMREHDPITGTQASQN